MKKLALIIFLNLVLSVCQGQVKESQLLGKWNVSDFKANLPDLSPAIINDARVEAMSSEYNLSSDHNYLLKSNFHIKGRSGNWSFNKNLNELTFTYPNSGEVGPETYTIKSINETKMVWVQNIEGIGTLTLVFSRK